MMSPTILQGLKIIIIGSSLYDDGIEIPDFVLNACIVLVLQDNVGERRYGYSMLLYRAGDSRS